MSSVTSQVLDALTKPLFWSAISGGLVVAFVYALSWPIQAMIGEPLMVMFVFIPALLVVLISVVCTLAHTLMFRRRLLVAAMPLLINGLLVSAVVVGMRYEVKPRLDFRLHQQARQQIVEQILSGGMRTEQVTYPAYAMVELPMQVRGLSRPFGSVMIYERDGGTHIVFLATNSIFQGFTGWVYRSDGKQPQLYPRALHGDQFQHVRPLAPRWFWVEYVD